MTGVQTCALPIWRRRNKEARQYAPSKCRKSTAENVDFYLTEYRKILFHFGNEDCEVLTGHFPAGDFDRGPWRDAFSIPEVKQKEAGRGSPRFPRRDGKPSSSAKSACRGSEFGTAGHVRGLPQTWYTLPYIIFIIRNLDDKRLPEIFAASALFS